jgi:hypothetical protein
MGIRKINDVDLRVVFFAAAAFVYWDTPKFRGRESSSRQLL